MVHQDCSQGLRLLPPVLAVVNRIDSRVIIHLDSEARVSLNLTHKAVPKFEQVPQTLLVPVSTKQGSEGFGSGGVG